MLELRFARAALLATLICALPMLDARPDATGQWRGGAMLSALADDDDDDDDDDGGSWGGGSSYEPAEAFFPTRRPARQRSRAPAPLLEEAPGELIVIGLDEEARASLEAQGYKLLDEQEDAALLSLPADVGFDAATQTIATMLPDALVAPNSYYRAQAEAGCTAGICESWRLAGFAPEATSCGFAPTIGVIDTGVNLDHEMLKHAQIKVTRFSREGSDPSGNRHGTAVVAMLVGAPDSRVPGMLPGARLHLADPFVTAAGDERADAFGLYRALQSLVAAEVEVINLSLAGPANPVIERAISEAGAAGVAVVAAVGNGGPQAEPLYPAAYDEVIAVTAIDHRRNPYRRAIQGDHVDFAAPGVGIATAASVRGVRPQTGTSFAVPFVTVALLVARAENPNATLSDHLEALGARSIDLGEAGRDPIFGHGLVQIGSPCGKQSAE